MTSRFFEVFEQGGLLSLYLFTVYVGDLSNTLKNAGIGCHINNCCANHVFYVDGLCVIVPSPCGLQALLNILWF